MHSCWTTATSMAHTFARHAKTCPAEGKTMRMLVVCQYYAPEPFRIADICVELAKRGHAVSVLSGIPNYPEGRFYKGYGLARRRKEILDGVRITRVPVLPRGRGGAFALALNYLSFVLSASWQAIRGGTEPCDVVLVYQLSPVFMAIPAILAGRRNKAPVVHYVADLWPESLSTAGGTGNKVILSAVGWIVDRIYRRSAAILVTSAGFTPSIVARGHPASKIRYIPQYPEDVYRPATVAAADPAKAEMPQGFVVVFTGNIGKAQGLEVLVSAAERLKEYRDISWVLIGDGRARVELQEKVSARGLGERVLFLGRKPMARIPTYLALSDIALLCLAPEPLFALTLPAKLQSYFACGIPIVGSIDGDAARVIAESGAGLAGAAGDAKALADNVLRLRESDEAERRRLSENALRYFESNFRKSGLIDRIEGCLREVADEYKATHGSRNDIRLGRRS